MGGGEAKIVADIVPLSSPFCDWCASLGIKRFRGKGDREKWKGGGRKKGEKQPSLFPHTVPFPPPKVSTPQTPKARKPWYSGYWSADSAGFLFSNTNSSRGGGETPLWKWVGLLQLLFSAQQIFRTWHAETAKDRIKHSSGSYWKLGLRYTSH